MDGDKDKEIKLIRKKIAAFNQDFSEMASEGFAEREMVRERISEFVHILEDAFNIREEIVMERVGIYGREIGELALIREARLDMCFYKISKIRRALWGSMKEMMLENRIGIEAVLEIADIYDPLFDKVLYAFSTAYMESYKENLQRAEDEFLLLSAPVVPVLDGVAVLPIIGGVDEKRAELLMKTVLKDASQKELSHIFIDLSGVTVIDTLVANYIYKIIQSLELVGVEAILAGIRPEVAQTMVSLGIDFAKIKTNKSLQQALHRHMKATDKNATK